MGCSQSAPAAVVEKSTLTTVGQTERMVSRAARINRASLVLQQQPDGAKRVKHPKLDAEGHLVQEEVVRRTSCAIQNRNAVLGTVDNPLAVEYAHWTQRGYYPDDPHKANQDELSVTMQFAGAESDAMLAVYDGHGKTGHSCARFACKRLPKLTDKHIRAARVKKYREYCRENNIKGAKFFDPVNWPYLTADEYKACSRRAFLECNKAMNDAETVDDQMSGTTAIAVNFHGNLVTISNVGDSRAVLGHRIPTGTAGGQAAALPEEEKAEIGEEINFDGATAGATATKPKVFPTDGQILAIPLSRDQTPYRKDERERVKKLGAAIMSIDQMEGHEEMHENWGDMVLGEDVDIHGDPPRVWIEGKDYPGTAFTRSLGDFKAEEVGVTAEPEMLARELTSNDHILVIASDGVFEFLTNQEVIDMCVKCTTPLEACEELVKRSYSKWLEYENRTDDITVIVCFLTCNKPPPIDGAEGTTEDLVVLAKSPYGNKPIRTKPRGAQDNLTVSAYAASEAEQNAMAKQVELGPEEAIYDPLKAGEKKTP